MNRSVRSNARRRQRPEPREPERSRPRRRRGRTGRRRRKRAPRPLLGPPAVPRGAGPFRRATTLSGRFARPPPRGRRQQPREKQLHSPPSLEWGPPTPPNPTRRTATSGTARSRFLRVTHRFTSTFLLTHSSLTSLSLSLSSLIEFLFYKKMRSFYSCESLRLEKEHK